VSFLGYAGFSVAALFLVAASPGPASFCDSNLVHETKDPMRYQMRPGRCEGIYAQQVGTVSLDLRSFVKGFGAFNPERDDQLVLTWSGPPGVVQDVRLRAFSLKPRTYFRMDTKQPAAQGSYAWPTDVLASVQLGRDDLGVVAWVDLPGPADRLRNVYLPLRAGKPKAAESGYQLTLVPSKRLKKILLTLSQTDERGAQVKTLFNNKDVGGEFGYYPSAEPTELPLGKIGPPGFYRLEIKATADAGDSVTNEIDFYHSGD